MRALLVGSGTVSTQIAVALQQRGHTLAAQIPFASPDMLDGFDMDVVVVVGAEAHVDSSQVNALAQKGLPVIVVAPAGSPLVSWAEGVGAPVFPYPPSSADMGDIVTAVERSVTEDEREKAQQYVRETLGGDWAARVQGAMAIRRIAVTSPKGGVGKTTLAANLAALYALTGIPVYAVDADINAGALRHHLKVYRTRGSLTAALHRFAEIQQVPRTTSMISTVSLNALLVDAFVGVDGLPTLRLLPGITADNQGDPILNDEELVQEAIRALYDLGVQQNGITIMDVGINPALPVHRWAIAHADAIVIVLKAEIPDADQVHVWLRNMVSSATRDLGDPNRALEFLSQRVKIVYNQVVDAGHVKNMHNLLTKILREQDVPVVPPIAAQIPLVPPDIAADAVNSAHVNDIFVVRYSRDHKASLHPFVTALLGLAAQFVPVVTEGASRVGLMASPKKKRRLKLW